MTKRHRGLGQARGLTEAPRDQGHCPSDAHAPVIGLPSGQPQPWHRVPWRGWLPHSSQGRTAGPAEWGLAYTGWGWPPELTQSRRLSRSPEPSGPRRRGDEGPSSAKTVLPHPECVDGVLLTPTLHVGQGQHSGASPPQRKDRGPSTAGGGVGPGGPAVGSGPGVGASLLPGCCSVSAESATATNTAIFSAVLTVHLTHSRADAV